MMGIRRLYGRVIGNEPRTGKFMAETQSNLETVQAGLAQVAVEIGTAEAAISAVALAAALDPAKQPEYDAALARLMVLRSRRSLLQEAIAAAEAAEAARVDERSDRERRAQARAEAAHLGNLQKRVARMAALQQEMQVEFSACMSAATSAVSLWPRHMNPMVELLSDDYIRDLIAVEQHRIGRTEIANLSGPRPPRRVAEHENPRDGALPTFVDIMAGHVAAIKSRFDPLAFSKPNPKPAVSSSAAGEPTVAASGEPATVGTLPEASGARAKVGDFAAVGVPGDASHETARASRPASGVPVLPGGTPTGYTVHVGHGGVVEKYAAELVREPEPDSATDLAPAVEMAFPEPGAGFVNVFAEDSQP
jgi:hypothetical protein